MSCIKCGGKLVGVSGDVKNSSGDEYRGIVGMDCIVCKEYYPCCLSCMSYGSESHSKWCNKDTKGLEVVRIFHLNWEKNNGTIK